MPTIFKQSCPIKPVSGDWQDCLTLEVSKEGSEYRLIIRRNGESEQYFSLEELKWIGEQLSKLQS